MRFDDTELTIAALPFRFVGPPVSMHFPAANTDREIAHGCPSMPDGFLQLASPEGGRIVQAPAKQWSPTTAWLRSDVANASAIVMFVILREAPRNVQPTS